MPTFNADQQHAIDAVNPNLLISAAAGSGKTTVMIRKIVETLTREEKASISQFLVITFTRDAAQNMKDKLRLLLENAAVNGDADPSLGAEENERRRKRAEQALSEIETATVSTIHSFCAQLIQEFGDDAGVAMNPRVLSESEKKCMLNESFADAVENLLQKNSPCTAEERRAVSELLLSYKSDTLVQMAQNLYNVLMGIAEPFAYLKNISENLPTDRWVREIVRAVDLDVAGVTKVLRDEQALMQSPLADEKYIETVKSDEEIIRNFLPKYAAAQTPEEKYNLLMAVKNDFQDPPRFKSSDPDIKAWKKAMNDTRGGIKGADGILMEAAKAIDNALSEDNAPINARIASELHALYLLVKEMDTCYTQKKRDAGAIDYADMEQLAYRITQDEDKLKELHKRYSYLYVDEYQDVSGIQDAIVEALAGEERRLFMVGDIKQSIYRFRHADPDLFEQKRQRYSDDENAHDRRIFFMDNYRSHQNIVDAVNAVFDEAMDKRVTDMDYLPQDRLRCNLDGSFGPVDVKLVCPEDGNVSRLEAQCSVAAEYIRSLIGSAAERGEQTYSYRDIVILLRKRASANDIADYLKKAGIPVMFEGTPDFFGLAEIKSFLNLITVIDNLHNDDALVGTLIAAPFCFDESDLAAIRLQKKDRAPFYEAFELCAARGEQPIDRKCATVLAQLKEWRAKSEKASVPDFIWELMRETGIYAARGAYPDGKSRQSNLDALYQRALDGQRAGLTRLSDFVNELREQRQSGGGDGDDHPAMGADDNFVRIMTMHKSKGLEFKVVILMELEKNITQNRGDKNLLMDIDSSDSALGLYLSAIVPGSGVKADSQGRIAFAKREQRKNIAEDTRLLYVAMTRAEDKLCLIGSMEPKHADKWYSRDKAARIWKTKSMLDMIMPAIVWRAESDTDVKPEGKLVLPEGSGVVQNALWRVERIGSISVEQSAKDTAARDQALQRLLARTPSADETAHMYLPEAADPHPLKTSVTTLVRQAKVLTEEDSEETVEDKRKAETAVRTFRLSTEMQQPAFLEAQQSTAADRGTAAHRFLRLIRLEVLREPGVDIPGAVRAEAERMKAAHILSDEEYRMVYLPAIADFFRSELGRRMLASSDVRREAAFTMRIAPDNPTMVQGIVDCVFKENGEWILVDYKTDRDTDPDTFVPRHAPQMNWYREAVERLTGIPVREMWLFALRAGQACRVERAEV